MKKLLCLAVCLFCISFTASAFAAVGEDLGRAFVASQLEKVLSGHSAKYDLDIFSHDSINDRYVFSGSVYSQSANGVTEGIFAGSLANAGDARILTIDFDSALGIAPRRIVAGSQQPVTEEAGQRDGNTHSPSPAAQLCRCTSSAGGCSSRMCDNQSSPCMYISSGSCRWINGRTDILPSY